MKLTILYPLILLAATGCPAVDSTVPFKLHRNYLIVIKCSLGGTADLTAILDTGVSETVLDLALVKRLSLPVGHTDDNALFLNNAFSVKEVLITSIRLGPVEVENLPGIATDLSGSTRELGIRPDLIIGMDVLHRQNFVIDYQSRRVSFGASRPMTWNAKLIGTARLIMIDSSVLGKKLRLQVDSGANGLLVYGKRYGPVTGSKLAGPGTKVVGVAASTRATAVDEAEVQVGNWHSYQGTVFFSGAPSKFPHFDGVLGLSMLRPRRVAFDFLQMMLYWE